MKPLFTETVDDIEYVYVEAAPSNEHCESLARYFEQTWQAKVTRHHDTGFSALYELSIGSAHFWLRHDSQTGNTLFSKDGKISKLIAAPLADLAKRLSA